MLTIKNENYLIKKHFETENWIILSDDTGSYSDNLYIHNKNVNETRYWGWCENWECGIRKIDRIVEWNLKNFFVIGKNIEEVCQMIWRNFPSKKDVIKTRGTQLRKEFSDKNLFNLMVQSLSFDHPMPNDFWAQIKRQGM